MRHRSIRSPCISDLRESPTAVADLLHRNIVSVEYGQQQIRKARILWILQVLTALDASVRMAQQSRWERIVVVPVAIAHVAAEKDRGVIEHSAVRLLRLR